MNPSIRTFLLINLLLSVTLITSLAIVANLYLAHKDIQSELDAQLVQSTIRMQAFFSNHQSKDLENIQPTITKLLKQGISLYTKRPASTQLAIRSSQLEGLEFQVWDNNGKLLLISPNAPRTPFTTLQTNGLSNHRTQNIKWRISSLYNPTNQLTVMVADKSTYRQYLENQLTQDSILIMLITYPFLGLLIWIIVGRGLHALETVASELKYRDPTFLEPVDTESVPSEIGPLVNELNELFSRLKNAFTRHERFTSDAAHELKTPLAALSAQTQFALRAETPDARNEALLKVLGGVNRCTHVVQQLLTFSRMCPEAGINDPGTVHLTKQASDIAAMLAPEAIAKNIELELVNPDSNASIIGNSTAIGILIRNLLDNAIRYSGEDGFVKIDISKTANDGAILRIIDSGPGIPEELRQRVFERFFRVIGNKTTGSGLGLGIVQQIVKLHKASIELLSPESGIGLEVRITFIQDPTKK